MKNSINKTDKSKSLIGSVKKYLRLLAALPALYENNTSNIMAVEKIELKLDELKKIAEENKANYIDVKTLFAELRSKKTTHIENSEHTQSEKKYFADNHLLDSFYLNFENEFRGSPELIAERQLEYIPLLKTVTQSKPILDIGCGRGEFLEILKENKLKALGVDLNDSMIKECNEKGLHSISADAIKYLSDAENKQFSAITAFHFVEHISFEDLLDFINECYRTLDDKGLVLFETPNPSNLTVGSHTFYLDPSHIRPLPPELLAFAMKTVGFRDVEIKLVHPENEFEGGTALETELYRRVFGARDYAIVAKK